MSLKAIVSSISMIRDFFMKNESFLRTLEEDKRTILVGHVKSALSRIFQALSVANLALDESGRQTVEETCRLLPICRPIVKSLDLALVEEWINMLVPKIHMTPPMFESSMVQVVSTLFSFVQSFGLAAFRHKFTNELAASIRLLATALTTSPFVVVKLPAFGGISLGSWNACASMQVSLLRLCSLILSSSSVFVSDLLTDCWFGACSGFSTKGSVLLVEASMDLLVQLVSRNAFPATMEDSFLRGLCVQLQAVKSTRSVEFDSALAKCVEVCFPSMSVLSLHAASDSFFACVLPVIQDTPSVRLQSVLLVSFRAFNDACRSNNFSMLLGLASKLDHQVELSNCLAHPSTRPVLPTLISSISISNNLDASTLLAHTRALLLSCRVFLTAPDDRLPESVTHKLTSLLSVLKLKIKPREGAQFWHSHLFVVYRFVCDFGARSLPALIGKDAFDSMVWLLVGGGLMSGPVAFEDRLALDTRMAWVQAVVSVQELPPGKVKDAVMGCIIRQTNHVLFEAALGFMTVWLKTASTDAVIFSQIAAEMLSEAAHAELLQPHVDALVSSAGLCICSVAECWRTGGSCSKRVVPWKNWSSLFTILKSRSAHATVVAAALEALARLLRHTSEQGAKEMEADLIPFVFEFALHESHLVRAVFSEHLVPAFASAYPKLVHSLQKTLLSNAPNVPVVVHASIVSALAKVAIFDDSPDSGVFLLAFTALISSFNHKNLEVRAAAYDGVREVARARGLTEAQLFARHEDEVFITLIKKLSEEPALLEEVAVFLDQTPIELLKRTLPSWLPKLVSEPAPEVLEEVASWLHVSLSELLTAHCVSVCLHILLEEEGFERASEFLIKVTGEPLDELMDSWMHDLMRELVVMMGESEPADRAKCEKGINRLALARLRRKDASRFKPLSKVEVADFISTCFLAIMEHLDNMLLPSNSNLAERKSAIMGFDQLIDLMARGNIAHLLSLRPKIIATLKLALKLPDLQLEACNTYRRFLDRLGIENIGPILGDIVVDLLPYTAQPESTLPSAGKLSELVISILDWLIVQNCSELKKFFRDVHFLPDIPALSKVRKVLDKGSVSLDDTLEQLVVGLQYESIDVRLMAIKKLMVTLRDHRKDIDAKILQRQRVAPIIEKLLPLLLSGSKGLASAEAKGQYAACLGMLGAIDPGRVELRLRLDLQMQLKDYDLAIELLNNHLVPALEEARNTETQGSAAFGRAAFAIQEVLKFCNCGVDIPNLARLIIEDNQKQIKDRRKREGVEVWKQLVPKTQAIVRPYLASCYQLTDESVPAPRSATYYSLYAQFRRWIGNFAAYLISRVSGPSSALFAACRSSVKDHDHIARFILPYLVFRLAQSESEMLKQEMHAVLQAEPSKSADMSQLCTQTVFHTIDVLVHWVEEKRKLLEQGTVVQSKSKRSKTSSSFLNGEEADDLPGDYAAVGMLLKSIPQLMIAKAALRCGAFARALKAVEAHVRDEQYGKDDTIKSAALAAVVPLLQQIFGGLEDSDGLEGLSKLRRCSNPEEQILEQEHRGNWYVALDWYEGAIRLNPSNADLRLGQLRCLLNVGHFETTLSLVRSARMMNLNRAAEFDDLGSATALSLVGGAGVAANRRESLLMAMTSNSQSDLSENLMSRVVDPTVAGQLLSSGMQAAWRLMHWQDVEQFSSSSLGLPKEDFEANIARCLLSLFKKDQPTFSKLLLQMRVDVMGPLLAASMDSYQRSFPSLVCLHMLSELEEMGTKLLIDGASVSSRTHWNARLKMTSASFRVRQGILHLRRVVSHIQNSSDPQLISKSWVEIARSARGDGQLEAARSALIQALSVDPKCVSALVEHARLLYIQGQRQTAIMQIEQVIKANSADKSAASGFSAKKQRAKPELLLGQWLHETGQKPFEGIKQQFEQVVKICPEWENGHFYVASYLDQVMKSMDADIAAKTPDTRSLEKEMMKLLPEVVRGYRMSLEKGYKHIHHSLPRLLTLYFKHGSEMHAKRQEKKQDTGMAAIEQQLHGEMKAGIRTIPMYVWLGAMPQLISRVCHDNPEVKLVLSELIQGVFAAFPKQVMWLAVGVLRATLRPEARKSIMGILQKMTASNEAVRKVYDETLLFADLVAKLSGLKMDANNTASKVKMASFAELSRLVKFQSPNVVIPIEAALMGALPLSGQNEPNWNAFEAQPPTVKGVLNDVEVIHSLQKPKVFTILGDNGKEYRFLAKPEDDLRKDSRVMEVNLLVNKLLSREPDSRRRQLRILTFSVVPLDEKNGLIEWVPNCQQYRNAALGISSNPKFKVAKDLYDKLKLAPPAERFQKVSAEFPLRFHQWFAMRFPEPMSWLDARQCFTRSCAVMSIVGTVIGLGDRHGDNILLDTKTGHVMHVDFNAIFNKGESFQVPERVPFRLTRNMVDAMGLSGYEGAFRRVCEITMHTLRKHREMVLSVLETFLYDPLVEFTITKDPSKRAAEASAASAAASKSVALGGKEPVNEKAKEIIGNIDRRLQGKVDSGSSGASRNLSRAVALSVEGHIEHLIQQATNPANLGAMFIGWSSFI